MIDNRKKIKYGNKRHLYTNLHLIDGYGMEITVFLVELMIEGALTSFTVGLCDAYRYFV